jgi:dienelactone hydrolase
VRILVWYPATPDPHSARVALGDLTRGPAPAEFADFGRRLEQRAHDELISMVQPTQVADLLGLSMFAVRDAPAARGRFPLMLIVPGLNDGAIGQAMLAEFLASHGYVVAVVEWTGATEDQFDASRTQVGIEATLRDAEFAWSRVRTRSDVDPKHLAVVGHSLGGIIAVLAAMRNGNVGAAVGLDATYGFAAATEWLTGSYGYAPRQMAAALLDVRRAAGEQGAELDLRAEHAFVFSDRTFVTLRNIRHSEFSTYSLVASATQQPPIPPERMTPGWTRETASVRYQQAIRMVLAFLDGTMKGDPSGTARVAAEVAGSPGATLLHEAALPLLPSAAEFIALVRTNGFDSAATLLEQHAGDVPAGTLIDAAGFNDLGYSLLEQ